jgi:2-polyprenyl-3-methyl-5-hydroxy-6-metoxy-1,4-benzoquinol methylase
MTQGRHGTWLGRPAPDFGPVLDRVACRYRGCGRSTYSYVKGKLAHDPVHRDVLTVAAAEPFADVLDIGCGRGQLGIALLEAGLASSVIGMDRQARQLVQASYAAGNLPFQIVAQDLSLAHDMPRATTVLLIDVLYQLADAAQEVVLRAACGAARERVIVRTLDPDRGVRSLLTLGLERLLRPVSPHCGTYVNPWQVARLLAVMTNLGFTTSVAPCWHRTPFANVLIIGRRTR